MLMMWKMSGLLEGFYSRSCRFTPNSSHAIPNPKPNQPQETEVEQMDGGESSKQGEAFSGNEGD
jgi:hypothetical protein